MQTSAPLLSAAPARASCDVPQLEWQGTLLSAAQARTKQLDGEGHLVPCLCMEIELDNAMRNHMHIEQPFPADQFKQAEQAAKALKKGMRVAVQLSPLDLKFIARNASSVVQIDVQSADEQQSEPDLFGAA